MSEKIDATIEVQSAQSHNNDSSGDDVTGQIAPENANHHSGDADIRPDQTNESEAITDQEKIVRLERELALSQEQIAELKNEYLRAHADAENYRKRIAREKTDAIQFANRRLLLDVIGVLDNFERALVAIEKTEANAALFDGVELIKKEWVSMLENSWGVCQIETAEQSFDPQLHEAVAIEEDDQATVEYVGEEFQKGYLLHSRVLRPAKVKVIKPKQGVT